VIPSNSKRFCPVCECIRTFQFSKVLGHSRCQVCLYHGEGVKGNKNGGDKNGTRRNN